MASERREFARALRKHPTRTEDILWAQLRGSRFEGAKFRRQVPVDRYVLDFYCHAAKLAIELDGKQHEWFADYDETRSDCCSGSESGSFASRTNRCATNSTPFSPGFARNCV